MSSEVLFEGLKPHPKNYNRHPDAQIKRLMLSLERFGQPKEIVIWRGLIVAGHGLVEAAKRLGWKTLRANDMSEAWDEGQALAFMAADNELARLGDPDEAALAALVAEMSGFDEELAALAAGSEERMRELLAEADLGQQWANEQERVEVLGAGDQVDKEDRAGSSPWDRVVATDKVRCLIGDLEFGVKKEFVVEWLANLRSQDVPLREAAEQWLEQALQ